MIRRNGLLISLLIGGAIFVVAFNFLRGLTQPTEVVVAKYDLNAGTRLTSDLLALNEVPQSVAPENAFRSLEAAAGKVLTTDRAAGDYITSYVAGDTDVAAGIPAVLAENAIAMGVAVEQDTGLVGVVREGQRVTVLLSIDPSVITFTRANATTPDSGAALTTGGQPVDGEIIPAEELAAAVTPTPQVPVSPAACFAVTGLKVLVVPQAFRYQEVPEIEGDQSALFANARTTLAGQEGSVVLLEVPLAPVEIQPDYAVSPALLLDLANQYGTIHLGLEPAEGLDQAGVSALPCLDIATMYEAVTGLDLNQ